MVSIIINNHIYRINVLETVIHIYEFSYAPYLFKICPRGLIRIHQKLLAPYFPQFFQQPVRFRFHPVPRRIQTDKFHPRPFQQIISITVRSKKNRFMPQFFYLFCNRNATHDMAHPHFAVCIRPNAYHLLHSIPPNTFSALSKISAICSISFLPYR